MKKIFILLFLCFNLLFADYNATQNAEDLNMYYQDYNFLMGMTGALVGFVIMLLTLYLITQIARK